MGNLYSLVTCTLLGAEAIPVTVEVDIGQGLPGFYIVGLADTAVQEARHRVRCALRSSGFRIPDANIVINLAPGLLRKTGSGFDLPIAVALLCATRQIPDDWVEGSLLVGELSLDGGVRPVHGVLACALLAGRSGLDLVSAPTVELGRETGVRCRALERLRDLNRPEPWARHPLRAAPLEVRTLDFSDIVGADIPKRAVQIAAAGKLGILLQGPPGSGKTMIAKRIPSILPPLEENERVESALIHSVAGSDSEGIFAGIPPFRSPHHSASVVGLIGGGTVTMKPGEVSLAHNGVLFLDEMNEFAPGVLQTLRQPMEDKQVTVVRADARVTFPADFMLVGAANPCPCGYLGDPERACRCAPQQIARYASRIGGPLMDRIDLVVDVWRSDPGTVLDTGKGLCSADMLSEVMAARERSVARKTCLGDARVSHDAFTVDICHMTDADRKVFEDLARRNHLSGRGVMRALWVARTIADLDGCDQVGEGHLLEALMFRLRGDAA